MLAALKPRADRGHDHAEGSDRPLDLDEEGGRGGHVEALASRWGWPDWNRGYRLDIELQEFLPEVEHQHIRRLGVAAGLDQFDPDICVHVVHPRASSVPVLTLTRPRGHAVVNAPGACLTGDGCRRCRITE
jgi:hypothetical protein